jgi:integrase
VFAKITETERSFFGSNAIKRKFSNERTNADGGEPNTAVAATKSGVSATRISFRRSPERDAAAILLAYRHGPRAAELTALCWAQVDLHTGRLHVNRAKGGICSVVQSYARCVGSYQRGATCSRPSKARQ